MADSSFRHIRVTEFGTLESELKPNKTTSDYLKILLRVDWWGDRSGIQKYIHYQQPLSEKVRISPSVRWSLELLWAAWGDSE